MTFTKTGEQKRKFFLGQQRDKALKLTFSDWPQPKLKQGNLWKGIVFWLVVARSVAQSPVRALDSNFSNTFSLLYTFSTFTNNVCHNLECGFFFGNYFIYKNCNFEPFCYVIKSVLIKKRRREKTFFIGSFPSILTNQMTIPFNKFPWTLEPVCCKKRQNIVPEQLLVWGIRALWRFWMVPNWS